MVEAWARRSVRERSDQIYSTGSISKNPNRKLIQPSERYKRSQVSYGVSPPGLKYKLVYNFYIYAIETQCKGAIVETNPAIILINPQVVLYISGLGKPSVAIWQTTNSHNFFWTFLMLYILKIPNPEIKKAYAGVFRNPFPCTYLANLDQCQCSRTQLLPRGLRNCIETNSYSQ